MEVLAAPVITVTSLLGIGVFDEDREEDLAVVGFVSKTKGKRSKVEGNMRTMRCERMTEVLVSNCYAASTNKQCCVLR